MFKLSQRKGSRMWQIRKRWPSDVASILKGEFVVSTGEEDKRLAQQRLPLLAAEYERRVAEARARLAAKPPEDLTEAEAHRMAADFYRQSLPRFVIKRPIQPVEQRALLEIARERLETAKLMQGRNEFGPVMPVAERMVGEAGIELPDDSPSWEYLHRMLMRAFVELHEAAAAHLAGNVDYRPKDCAMVDVPAAPEVVAERDDERTIEKLIEAYEADKGKRWSGSTKKAVVPVFRVMRDVFPGRAVASITRDEARGVVSLLEGLPANMGKRKDLVGLTVPQAVEKAKKLGLPTIQPKTINDGYLLHIASLFNWARKEQWVVSKLGGHLSATVGHTLGEQQLFTSPLPFGHMRQQGVTYRDLIERIEQNHKPIASSFRQGRGLELQRIDSDIVERVTGYLIHRGICCLPVHEARCQAAGAPACRRL